MCWDTCRWGPTRSSFKNPSARPTLLRRSSGRSWRSRAASLSRKQFGDPCERNARAILCRLGDGYLPSLTASNATSYVSAWFDARIAGGDRICLWPPLANEMVGDMIHTALAPLIGPEFDKFLGASIGANRNGTTVSMLSALARLDVDPWREAVALARMPEEAATRRLTALIGALSEEPLGVTRGEASAGDLVALLPRMARFPVASPETTLAIVGLPAVQARFAVSALAILVAIAFALSVVASSKGGTGAGSVAPSVERSTTDLSR